MNNKNFIVAALVLGLAFLCAPGAHAEGAAPFNSTNFSGLTAPKSCQSGFCGAGIP